MASESVLSRLEAEFDAPPASIRAVVSLLEDAAPPQYISRFRRDETGDLGEERICALEERWHFLQDIEARKEAVLQQAEQSGAVTDELRATLASTFDQDLLDDIYQSFRPRRRTAGMQAEEKGVGPLALAIHHRNLGDKTLQQLAAEYVSAERGLPTEESVLEAVAHILAERYAGDPKLRAQIRDELSRGILKATATAPDRKGAKRYQDFFDFAEPVRRISAHRMLALRRAEREGIIKVELRLPEGRELEIFRARFASDLDPASPLLPFLDLVFRHTHEQLVRPACEADIRRRAKEKADRETVRNYARNLRSQLLSPPLGPRRTMALRASSKTVWLVVVDEDGSLRRHHTVHIEDRTGGEGRAAPEPAAALPVPAAEPIAESVAPASTDAGAAAEAGVDAAVATVAPPAESAPAEAAAAPEANEESEAEQHRHRSMTRAEVVALIAECIETERPAGIAIPHGRRQELSEGLLTEALARVSGPRPLWVPVDEAASAIFASSAGGRRALPGNEVGIRTAVSLARRLQDPLLELLAMEPRELGLGHGAGEVHQGMLTRQLDAVVASCLAAIGLDLNRASPELLARVPGLDKEQARLIAEHRRQHGGFRSLAALRDVPGLSERVHRYAAAFLRVFGGDEPLDATPVHPENYPLVHQIAAMQTCSVTELFGKSLRGVEVDRLVSAEVGRLRTLDVLHGLSTVGRDPRGTLTTWTNEGVKSMSDLQVDMQLRGRVTNLTEFGAFVDLGIGQDGLVHISQIPGSRLRDPDRMLRVGEVIQVYVTKIDTANRRIGLSMHRPRHLAENRRPTVGERMESGKGRARRREEPELQSRAARAPEHRRGDRRGPRRSGQKNDAQFGGEGGGRPMRGPRGDFGSRAAEPRVFTVESDKPIEQSRGHKGELRSLAGLRKLLGSSSEGDQPGSGES
jgi:uncharacterized protein